MRPERVVALSLALLGACSTEAAPRLESAAPVRARSEQCGSDADCDDGLVCSGLERCLDGRCWSGRPPQCDDDDACTTDLCLEPLGCTVQASGLCQPLTSEDAAAAFDAGALLDARIPLDATPPRSEAGYHARLPDYCAGNVLTGVVIATQQETLDKLAGVRCIDGDLRLSGFELHSLLALASLRWVAGDVVVRDATQLEQLTGLDFIEYIGGALTLENLRGAASWAPFGSLRELGGGLRMANVERLEQLAGFSALEQVHGSLMLEGLARLRDLSQAFALLSELHGDLTLRALGALDYLDAFNALSTLHGDLRLEVSLESLGGFARLETVDRGVDLQLVRRMAGSFPQLRHVAEVYLWADNLLQFEAFDQLEALGSLTVQFGSIEQLGGFGRLRRVNELTLLRLPKLRQVDAFSQLEEIGDGGLTLHDTALEDLSALRALRRVAGAVRLSKLPALTSIALPALTSLGALELRDCPPISSCEVAQFTRQLGAQSPAPNYLWGEIRQCAGSCEGARCP